MSREMKTVPVVHCVKYNAEMIGLDRPPFPGELGQRIFNNISKMGYESWQAQATLIINHYGLNMADPQSQEILFQQMEDFFFGSGSGQPITGAPVGGKGGAPRK